MVIFLPLSLLMTIAAVTSPDMPLRVVSGFRMEDVRIKTDSVTDFSFISKYGSAVEWQYFRKDSHIIEHRGNEWLRFSQRADTLELRHRETCREKRESRIILSPHVAADTVYSSNTRRDRSFLYSDSGSYIITQSRCPLLILAEGDTLHDVTAEKIRVSYCRRQISGDGETSKNLFPKFIETETTWRAGQDNSIPYAMTRSIERISKANDTTITVESVCFPRALNVVGSGFDRQYTRKGSKTPVYLQQTEQMKEAAEAPHFEVTGNSLHVSDHAPHAREEKDKSMADAVFGIVGLETSAALTFTSLVKTGLLSMMDMAEKMSFNPAKILGLDDRGSVSEGKRADIAIFDPSRTYRIDKNTFASKGKNTPFDGFEATGEVVCTLVDGKVVYDTFC